MLQHNSNRILLIGVACLAIGSIAIPALAVDGQWHIRAHAAWVQPDLNWQMSPEGGTAIAVDANSAWGLGINGEYQVSELLGVELGIMRAVPDIDLHVENRDLGLSASASDGLTMTPLSLGLNFHLTPGQRYDLYLGPFLAYVLYSDLEWRVNETLDVDGVLVVIDETLRMSVANDLAYGAVAGADIPIGFRGWYLSGTLRYMATELDVTSPEGDSENLSLDPIIVTLGVRYSF